MLARVMIAAGMIPLYLVDAPAQGPVGTSVLSGMVVDDAGKPEPSAEVSCQKLNEYSRTNGRMVLREAGFVRRAAVDSGGRFMFQNLPPGQYHVCAAGGRPNSVGSCEWGGVPVLTLGPGQNFQNIIRTVREGSIITLRVADPNRRIALPDVHGFSPREGRFSLDLVSPTGSQRRAKRISSSPSEHVFQITIPRQWQMRLFLDTGLRVTGEGGALLETRRPATQVVSAAGREQVTVYLNVP